MRELERVTRRYVSEIFGFLGPDKDVPAPDVGTNAQVMAWVMDQYSIGIGHAVPGVVTGKPVAFGGSVGREKATGQGLVDVLEAMLPELRDRPGLEVVGDLQEMQFDGGLLRNPWPEGH